MGILDYFKEKVTRKPKEPFEPFSVVVDSKGDFEDFSRRMLRSSTIMLVIGKRGSGKTALGMSMLEYYYKNNQAKCYAVGFSRKDVPRWIKPVDSFESIPNNSVALLDEGAVLFSSRDSMKQSNKGLGKLMAIARHKSLSLIVITQNSAMLDLNVIRLADTVLLKEPSLMQAKFERKALKDMYFDVVPHFKDLKNKKAHAYVFDDEFEGLIHVPLPEFWSTKISKSFSKA